MGAQRFRVARTSDGVYYSDANLPSDKLNLNFYSSCHILWMKFKVLQEQSFGEVLWEIYFDIQTSSLNRIP